MGRTHLMSPSLLSLVILEHKFTLSNRQASCRILLAIEIHSPAGGGFHYQLPLVGMQEASNLPLLSCQRRVVSTGRCLHPQILANLSSRHVPEI